MTVFEEIAANVGLPVVVVRVLIGLLLVVVGVALSRIVRWVLHRVFTGRRTPSFARVMSRLAGWLIATIFIFAAVVAVFPSVRPVDALAGLGFFSVAAAFAFRDILENLLAGVLLLLRQPFQSGDQITVSGQSGTVEAITIRETRLTTFDGQLVLIPNRDVYKSVIVVRTAYPSRRLDFVVGVAYENDVEEACRIVEQALAGLPRLVGDPQPEALVAALGVSTVDIEVRFWAGPDQHDSRVALSAAIIATKLALDDAGIEMPADIIALQATPSFRAAVQGVGDVTPGGGVRA
ncbi:MAG: mechanosensitive ion channel family protein [Aeromicrobium sp.]|uniref:mechanosensitive ion channel family protein n=1 Tax=Aeromicrobium sp. TaxID=1871063 RepID=UPI003C4A2DF6